MEVGAGVGVDALEGRAPAGSASIVSAAGFQTSVRRFRFERLRLPLGLQRAQAWVYADSNHIVDEWHQLRANRPKGRASPRPGKAGSSARVSPNWGRGSSRCAPNRHLVEPPNSRELEAP